MTKPKSDGLFEAVYGDDAPALRLLSQAGVTVNRRAENGNTALRAACSTNALCALRILLELGADPNQTSAYRSPVSGRFEGELYPLMHAKSSEAVDLLVEYGALVDALDINGMSALMHAAADGNDGAVQSLHLHGANPTLRKLETSGSASLNALEIARSSLLRWEPEDHQFTAYTTALIPKLRRVVDLLAACAAT